MGLREEKRLWKKGYKIVACLDEAGRGSLVGPVVASAVVITTAKIKNQKSKIKNVLKEVRDSKKLSPVKREKLYKILTRSDLIKWGVGKVSEKVIDKINILEATKLAMIKAIRNLEEKIGRKVDFLLIDGNFTIPYSHNSPGRIRIPEQSPKDGATLPYSHAQKSIIKADEKVFSCSVASIIAKVTRDRIMHRYHKKYPQYGFDKHKGYPTKFHLKMLKKYGSCKIHRKTFEPVKKLKLKARNCRLKLKSY